MKYKCILILTLIILLTKSSLISALVSGQTFNSNPGMFQVYSFDNPVSLRLGNHLVNR